MNELDIEMDKYFTKCRYDWFIGFWVWGIKWSDDFVHVHCRNMLLIFFYGSSGSFHCSFQNNTNHLWYRQYLSWSFNFGDTKLKGNDFTNWIFLIQGRQFFSLFSKKWFNSLLQTEPHIVCQTISQILIVLVKYNFVNASIENGER